MCGVARRSIDRSIDGGVSLCSSKAVSRAILHHPTSRWRCHQCRIPRHRYNRRPCQRVSSLFQNTVTLCYFLCLGLFIRTGSGQLSVWRLSDKRQMWTQSCPAGITSVIRLPLCVRTGPHFFGLSGRFQLPCRRQATEGRRGDALEHTDRETRLFRDRRKPKFLSPLPLFLPSHNR